MEAVVGRAALFVRAVLFVLFVGCPNLPLFNVEHLIRCCGAFVLQVSMKHGSRDRYPSQPSHWTTGYWTAGLFNFYFSEPKK